MNSAVLRSNRLFQILAVCLLGLAGCDRDGRGNGLRSERKLSSGDLTEDGDKVAEEKVRFQHETRSFYNTRNFDALEKRANEMRESKARYGDGAWNIYNFYHSLRCREDEPESMWQLHSQIHEEWEKAKPRSITARLAHADFLFEYAWHARGDGYADTVTPEGWRLFAERIAAARTALDESSDWEPKCPMWWLLYLQVALAQGWENADYERMFSEAKSFEPQFWRYDVARAKYLLPRWHGKEGDWEKAAEVEAGRAGGLGPEIYARLVVMQRGYYNNVFRESDASWPKTREGFELMRQRYPDSLEILSSYCSLACLAEDRPQARKLFDELGNHVSLYIWGNRQRFLNNRAWAYAE